MEMIATSDCTALSAINTAARIATLNGMSTSGAATGLATPNARPKAMNTTSGITSVATNPIGSRVKILVSSQVSFQNPCRNRGCIQSLMPWPVSFRHILERRDLGTEAAHSNALACDDID